MRPPGDHRVTFAVVAAAATRLPGRAPAELLMGKLMSQLTKCA
ncbi:hypothetical protein I551_6023 [Mycobacterium ulcerans str. Harvey]|uniref:Uncharacterized protein n=1 Tax=Mycobacterium ulcerans str. Harvey TaxID=1299332 RepID=A0ABN0QS37_MYCUL|nr:hypothetical protein I551_6023 [Mycobacterium ulcerans str. Harvey]